MSFPRKFLNYLKFWLILVLLASPAFALVEKQPIHFSGDRQLWDRRANRVELFGHAAVVQVGETLTADYILLDLKERTLDAHGSCVYTASDASIWAKEMHFNLDTRTGTVIDGRVTNDKFSLRGKKIDKLGEGRFQTHWGDYTTCRDCSPSWSILSEDVDMEIEGYAYMTNVTTRVKDAPAFWLPYMAVPMKSKRQTGFLFPPFTLSGSNGATFVLPFFWAINRSSDMTFGVGEYTARGRRFQWEGRYSLSNRSSGKADFSFISDRTFQLAPYRWAADVTITQELPWHVDAKLKLAQVSDNLYPYFFPADVSGAGEAFQKSSFSLSKGSSDYNTYLAIQYYRNLIPLAGGDPNAQQIQFDPKTVQALPSAGITLNDRNLWDTPFVAGLNLGYTHFNRPAGFFDYDNSNVPFGSAPLVNPPPFTPGVDPIRKAQRFSFSPTVYTTLRPFDTFSLVPSVQYRGYFYDFGGQVTPLNRGYLLFQTDLSTQLEKIYEFPDDSLTPKAKHLIRPLLTYSYIPYVHEDTSHPFLAQIRNAQQNNLAGYNFDDYDIVPITYSQSSANYFVPQGNSLAYGFSTQWIRRRSPVTQEMPSYQTTVEFSAGQAINFLEVSRPINPASPHVFTRFFSNLNLNFDKFNSGTTYYYYPDIPPETPRHTISTYSTLIFERAMHQRILAFDRSVTVGYAYNKVNGLTNSIYTTLNFSLSDYLMPFGTIRYGFEPALLYGASAGIQLQSPSQCWKFVSGLNYNSTVGITWSFDLALNLTGSGFGGVTNLASSGTQSQPPQTAQEPMPLPQASPTPESPPRSP